MGTFLKDKQLPVSSTESTREIQDLSFQIFFFLVLKDAPYIPLKQE